VVTLRQANQLGAQYGTVSASQFGSPLVSAPGVTLSTPASAAQNARGETYVAAINDCGRLSVNIFTIAQTWTGWLQAPSANAGTVCTPTRWGPNSYAPGIAIDYQYGIVWVATSSQLVAYDPALGLRTPIQLGHFFDRGQGAMAVLVSNGKVYVVYASVSREDDTNQIVLGVYDPGRGFAGWSAAPRAFPLTKDAISVAAGSDGAVYVAAMDTSGSLWMSRFYDSEWGAWYTVPGVFLTTEPAQFPKIAAGDRRIFAVGLDPYYRVWMNSFSYGIGNGWGTWTYLTGSLYTFALAVMQDHLYVAGASGDGVFWWYSDATRWRPLATMPYGYPYVEAVPR